jgi:hypothetical protein
LGSRKTCSEDESEIFIRDFRHNISLSKPLDPKYQRLKSAVYAVTTDKYPPRGMKSPDVETKNGLG